MIWRMMSKKYGNFLTADSASVTIYVNCTMLVSSIFTESCRINLTSFTLFSYTGVKIQNKSILQNTFPNFDIWCKNVLYKSIKIRKQIGHFYTKFL